MSLYLVFNVGIFAHFSTGIVTDFTDPRYIGHFIRALQASHIQYSLTNIIMRLTEEYLDIPYVETKCGYACSDQ